MADERPTAEENVPSTDEFEDVETQTYGEIAWEQFRKYRLAYAALWAVVGLVLLAIYAPLLTSDLPFTIERPNPVVGTGNATGCGANDLRVAVDHGGDVEFKCGDKPVFITGDMHHTLFAAIENAELVGSVESRDKVSTLLTIPHPDKTPLDAPIDEFNTMKGVNVDGVVIFGYVAGPDSKLEAGSSTAHPWIENVVNKTYYASTVDIIFNTLIFLLPLCVFLYFIVAWTVTEMSRRDGRRIKQKTLFSLAALIIIVDGWIIMDPLAESASATAMVVWIALAAAFPAYLMWKLGGLIARKLELAGGARQALAGVCAAIVILPALFVVSDVAFSVGPSEIRPHGTVARTVGWYNATLPTPTDQLLGLHGKNHGRMLEAMAIDPLTGVAASETPPDDAAAKIQKLIQEPGFRASHAFIPYSFRSVSKESERGASARHLFGTDVIGHDVFAMMVFGTRIALTIGIVAVGIYITIGIILGALAGYFGGWVDMLIVRFIEIMLCFPVLFLIMTLASFVEEPSVFYVMIIIGVTRWTGPARLVRGEFLRLRNQEFVQAAKALGLPEWRIIFKHILPNALGPVLVAATFGVASAILIESTLSFLGLGDPATPTWGKILNDGRVFKNNIMILLPGFAIFVTVSLFNLMGEGLRDALDPKMRR